VGVSRDYPNFLGTPISSGTGKAADFKFCRIIHRVDWKFLERKPMKNVGNSSRGSSRGVPKIFRATMYRAHCADIFAIAQLSCTYMDTRQLSHDATVDDLGDISRSRDCFTSIFSRKVCNTAKVTVDY